MNKNLAKQIAQKITNEQLKLMFDNAKANIKNWNIISNVNKGMSKGVAWNILADNFDINENYHILAKTNMIREFGEYLSDEFKPNKKKKETQSFVHQNPKFLNEL